MLPLEGLQGGEPCSGLRACNVWLLGQKGDTALRAPVHLQQVILPINKQGTRQDIAQLCSVHPKNQKREKRKPHLTNAT